jgi:hypothetical protein
MSDVWSFGIVGKPLSNKTIFFLIDLFSCIIDFLLFFEVYEIIARKLPHEGVETSVVAQQIRLYLFIAKISLSPHQRDRKMML